jgi:hypothetical protein
MSEKLNFGNDGNADPFGGFDQATTPGEFDLTGFDTATGATTIPAGSYLLKIERGELSTTRTTSKPCYRIRFRVIGSTPHDGFVVWKTLTLDGADAFNRAKRFLAALGITTSAKLREPFPEFGTEVFVTGLVSLRAAANGFPARNDVERVTLAPAPVAAVNPFQVVPHTTEGANQ